MSNPTYVYDGLEVECTGRKANRMRTTAKSESSPPQLSPQLVEIQPVDKSIPWKKWVRFAELYEITENGS